MVLIRIQLKQLVDINGKTKKTKADREHWSYWMRVYQRKSCIFTYINPIQSALHLEVENRREKSEASIPDLSILHLRGNLTRKLLTAALAMSNINVLNLT